MTVVTNQKGSGVTALDASDLTVAANVKNPIGRMTSGEGAAGHVRIVEDIVSLPTTFFSATGNYARLCRIPSNAKIKRVQVQTDAPVDAHATAGTAAFSLSVGWSDADDHTPPSFQGTVPSKNKDGTNVAIANANDNKLFGTVTAPAATAKVPLTDVTTNGDIPTTYSYAEVIQKPLEAIFAFKSPLGADNHGIGFLDVIVESTATYATVPTTAANLMVKVEYVI